MSHTQVMFRSQAREKILRGAQRGGRRRAGDARPTSKCVLIERKFGAPLVCNDGVTIAKETNLEDPGENLGAQMIRQAAERTGDAVGDGTTTVDDPGAGDLCRGGPQRRGRRERGRPQARPRPRLRAAVARLRELSRPVKSRQGEGAGRDDLGAQRPDDRRAGRRRDREGRRRGRDHGRGGQGDRDHRSRSSRACSSIAGTCRPTSSPTRSEWSACSRTPLYPDPDKQALGHEGPAAAARAGRRAAAAAAHHRGGRRGRSARDAGRQQAPGRRCAASP